MDFDSYTLYLKNKSNTYKYKTQLFFKYFECAQNFYTQISLTEM